MTTEEYIAAQDKWLKANNIQDGSKVRIFRIAEAYEDGWGDGWNDEMDSCLGLIGTVQINTSLEHGIKVVFDEGCRWFFPYFVLDPTLKREAITKEEWADRRRAEMCTNNDVINLLARWLSRGFDCPYGEDHECNYKCGFTCRDMKRQHPECWISAAKEMLTRGEK